MKNILRVVGILAGAGAVIAACAIPAHALPVAALPKTDDVLLAMTYTGSGSNGGSIDVTTGAAVGLATPRVEGDGFTGGDYDATTGKAYLINEIFGQTLQVIDPATGAITTIAPMWEGSPSNYPYVRSIAIAADGAAYAIVNRHVLYSLNVVTAELTYIADTGLSDAYSFDFNPIDGLLYAVDYGAGGVFTIDPTNGTSTRVGEWTGGGICGFQIDSNGVAWYHLGGYLFSATDLTDMAGTSVAAGPLTIDGQSPAIYALLYVPVFVPPVDPPVDPGVSGIPQRLATTGSDGTVVVNAGGIVVLSFAAGGLLLVRRRRASS